MTQPSNSTNNRTEWKILAAQIVIGILGLVEIVMHGDGNVLASVIVAESTLCGVQIALSNKG